MFLSADLANLLFYCAQQLGVTLGVGAETIMLAAYLISMRDGVVDEKETQYARAIKRTMALGLWLIVISGLGITVLHVVAGETATILTPAYLFKWLLVLGAVLLTLLRKIYPISLVEGLIGGTWYAIFLVHILAPVTGWFNLGTLYAVWLGGFVLCWEIVVVMHKDKKPGVKNASVPIKKEVLSEPVKPLPIVVPPPPPTPLPAIVLAPDLPKPTPPPPPAPVVVAPPPPPPPAPVAPPAKVETIAVAKASPFESIAPSPAGRVTDTPFLPKVAPLQPMTQTLGNMVPTAPATPIANAPSPAATPVTTVPGGTSTPPTSSVPLVQEGLSAMNIMPKAPPAK